MAFLNDLWSDIKTNARLKATAMVLHKLDTERIADYLIDYGQKYYGRGRRDFMDMVYLQLLELVSAVNRRRGK